MLKRLRVSLAKFFRQNPYLLTLGFAGPAHTERKNKCNVCRSGCLPHRSSEKFYVCISSDNSLPPSRFSFRRELLNSRRPKGFSTERSWEDLNQRILCKIKFFDFFHYRFCELGQHLICSMRIVKKIHENNDICLGGSKATILEIFLMNEDADISGTNIKSRCPRHGLLDSRPNNCVYFQRAHGAWYSFDCHYGHLRPPFLIQNQNSTEGAILSSSWVPNGIQFASKQIPGSCASSLPSNPIYITSQNKNSPTGELFLF